MENKINKKRCKAHLKSVVLIDVCKQNTIEKV